MDAKGPNARVMVRLLLADYSETMQAVKRDAFNKKEIARYDLFEPISEADIVDLFQEDKFPLDAAAFIENLQLRSTDGRHSKII